jgi:uncharacterized membrane protein (UPF0127 family)
MSIISDLILVGVGLLLEAPKAKLEFMKKRSIKKYITEKRRKNRFIRAVEEHKFRTFVIIFCLIVAFLALHASRLINAKEILQFNQDPKNYNVKLQILDKNKEIANFMVAVPNDDSKKIYGLMHLKHLPENHGMLFTFITKRVITMWMKNTKIPLDMLFIDDNNIIVNIKENNPPYSLDLINSEVQASKVLEINAGLVKKYNIKIGQRLKIN